MEAQVKILLLAANEWNERNMGAITDSRVSFGWWKRNRNLLQKAGHDRNEANYLMNELQKELSR